MVKYNMRIHENFFLRKKETKIFISHLMKVGKLALALVLTLVFGASQDFVMADTTNDPPKVIITNMDRFYEAEPLIWRTISGGGGMWTPVRVDQNLIELKQVNTGLQLLFDLEKNIFLKQDAATVGYVQTGTITGHASLSAASINALEYVEFDGTTYKATRLDKIYVDGNPTGWQERTASSGMVFVADKYKDKSNLQGLDILEAIENGDLTIDESVLVASKTTTQRPLNWLQPYQGVSMMKSGSGNLFCVTGLLCDYATNARSCFAGGTAIPPACTVVETSSSTHESLGMFVLDRLVWCPTVGSFDFSGRPSDLCAEPERYQTRFVKVSATEWSIDVLRNQVEVTDFINRYGKPSPLPGVGKLWTQDSSGAPIKGPLGSIALVTSPKTSRVGLGLSPSGTSVMNPFYAANDLDWLKVAYQQNLIANQYVTPLPVVLPGQEISPGFQVMNQTTLPVLVSLSQASCIYYGIVQPGETFDRDTGAVWFTLEAEIAPELEEPSLGSCLVEPLIATAAVAITIASGGTAAVPAALLLSAGAGTAWAVEASLKEGGMSEEDASWVGTGILLASSFGAGLALPAEGTAFGMATKANKARKIFALPVVDLATAVAATTVKQRVAYLATQAIVKRVVSLASSEAYGSVEGQKAVSVLDQDSTYREATKEELEALTESLSQTVTKAGVYAGYPWPWKQEDRIKPLWIVTGGPIKYTSPEGMVMYQEQDTPLTLTQVR